MKDTVYVYALIDPRNNEVRYVGLTNNPHVRLKAHLRSKHGIDRTAWIAELKAAGLEPRMAILEESDSTDCYRIEHFWYMHYTHNGARLTNTVSTDPVPPIKTRKSFTFALTGKRKRLLGVLASLLNESGDLPASHWNGSNDLTSLIERALEIAVDSVNEGFLNSDTHSKLGD